MMKKHELWTPTWAAVLLAVCAGCPPANPPANPPASPADAEARAMTTAGDDLSGADCEIWIAPGGQREMRLWFETQADASTSPPEPLEIHMRSNNDTYCVGGQEVITTASRTLHVKINADGTVNSVYLKDPGSPVTHAWSASDLPDKDVSVFGADLSNSGDFDLHVHYAGAALVIACEKGGCP